jgi:hypothetical protein
LLSKGLQGVKLAHDRSATTTEASKRLSLSGDIERPPAKRRRKTNVSSHFHSSLSNVTHTVECVEMVRKLISDGSLEPQSSKNILEYSESQLRAPPSTTKSRKRKNREVGEMRGYDTISVIERPLPTSKRTDTTFTPEAPTATPRTKRKRKLPTSTYFNVPSSQLSTLPTTPIPFRHARGRESKVSVIESFDEPASLPHFRPTSPNEFGLIQEKLRHEPWKMLVAVIFLNKTTAKVAIPLLGQLFERWPTPEVLSQGAPRSTQS